MPPYPGIQDSQDLQDSGTELHSGPENPRESGPRGVRGEEELEQDLRQVVEGVATPRFCFQPIADLCHAMTAGYEALVRLPVRAGLPPDECMRAAGRFGLQIELEEQITRFALLARDRLPANSFLSINVSPAFLISEAWERVFATRSDLHRVVLEITEEQSIADYALVRERMALIRARGGMVAIDDAGAGYASLRHILELRPAFIKLDRDFVRHCDTDRAKSSLIEMMGAAASRMDAWIIAEGVETSSELTELLRLGVPLAQGYFLGRPESQMQELLPQARQSLETFVLHRMAEEALLLQAETCPAVSSRAEAENLLAQQAECGFVAVTDGWGRPLALLERHPLLGARSVPEFLVCQSSSDLALALDRALTRPADRVFDPLVLISGRGHFQGVARVDRLVQAVLHSGRSNGLSPVRARN